MDAYDSAVQQLTRMRPEDQADIAKLADMFYSDRLKNTRSKRMLQDPTYHHNQKTFALREAITFHNERTAYIREQKSVIEQEFNQ